MVRHHEKSTRKGIRKSDSGMSKREKRRVKLRRMDKTRVSNAPRVYTAAQKKEKCKYSKEWVKLLTKLDKQQTQAVKEAQAKEKKGCLRPSGWRALVGSLERSQRRAPQKGGAKCICLPQGHPEQEGVAIWMPCFFVTFYHPINEKAPLAILERVEMMLHADKRLGKFFVVRASDVFLVPSSFSDSFLTLFEANTGVYVIQSESGNDVYVGWSMNIRKRIHFHNQGKGAMFTMGRKWFRIRPVLEGAANAPKSKRPGEQHSHESLELIQQVRLNGPDFVFGGHKNKTQYKQKK